MNSTDPGSGGGSTTVDDGDGGPFVGGSNGTTTATSTPTKTEPTDGPVVTSVVTVTTGKTITLSGSGFAAGESITLALTVGKSTKSTRSTRRALAVVSAESVSLGTTRADAAGSFSSLVTIPSSVVAGSYEINATGTTHSAVWAIIVVAATLPTTR